MGRHRGAGPRRDLPPEVSWRGCCCSPAQASSSSAPARGPRHGCGSAPRRSASPPAAGAAAPPRSPAVPPAPSWQARHQGRQVAAVLALGVEAVPVARLGGAGGDGVARSPRGAPDRPRADRRTGCLAERVEIVDRDLQGRHRPQRPDSTRPRGQDREDGRRLGVPPLVPQRRERRRAQERVRDSQGAFPPAVQLAAHQRQDLPLVGDERRNRCSRIGRKVGIHRPQCRRWWRPLPSRRLAGRGGPTRRVSRSAPRFRRCPRGGGRRTSRRRSSAGRARDRP